MKVIVLFFKFGSSEKLFLCENYKIRNNRFHFWDLIGKEFESICEKYFLFKREVEVNGSEAL